MIGSITLKQLGSIELRLEAHEPNSMDYLSGNDDLAQDLIECGFLVAFDAKVSVLRKGVEIGSDWLGGCIYESLEDFRTSDFIVNGKTASFPGSQGYARDMMHEALDAARKWAE